MRASDADILIVPGWDNSPPNHWQSRWQQKLSTARRVEQRDFSRPVLAEWRAVIERAVEDCARPVVIVAHSLGVLATLHASAHVGEKITGAFLVAPPSDRAIRETPEIDAAFLPYPRSRLPFKATLVGSENDPFAELSFARELAEAIGATYLDAGASGHINVETGHGPWPEGSMAFAHFLAGL